MELSAETAEGFVVRGSDRPLPARLTALPVKFEGQSQAPLPCKPNGLCDSHTVFAYGAHRRPAERSARPLDASNVICPGLRARRVAALAARAKGAWFLHPLRLLDRARGDGCYASSYFVPPQGA